MESSGHSYPYNDPGQMPIVPVRDSDGEWFRLKVDLPGQSLWLARMAGAGRPGDPVSP